MSPPRAAARAAAAPARDVSHLASFSSSEKDAFAVHSPPPPPPPPFDSPPTLFSPTSPACACVGISSHSDGSGARAVTRSRARPNAALAAFTSAAVLTTPCVANIKPNVYPTAARYTPTGTCPLFTRYPPKVYNTTSER